MFFNKEKKKSNYVKAKTPEARKKQKEAIAAYYAKKNNSTKRKNKRVSRLLRGDWGRTAHKPYPAST